MTAATLPSPRVKPRKAIPTRYETDDSKYVGPHRWQIQWWARIVRRLWRHRAYTQWLTQACSRIEIFGEEHLAGIDGPCVFVANHQSHIDTLLAHAALPEAIRSRVYFGAAQDRWFVKGKKKLTLPASVRPSKMRLPMPARRNSQRFRSAGRRQRTAARRRPSWRCGTQRPLMLRPTSQPAATPP